jgi:RNA-directed DNA polymerase
MLEERIDDKALIQLIRKWLKAGILETDGQVIHPETGTPQGGIISPMLANIYMHYVLNLWFEKVVKKHCKGKAYLSVYADDFVCAFECESDAERFYKVLGKRLGKFGLKLSDEKTSIIRFSRYQKERNGTFDYLGFTFRWRKSRSGKDWLKRTTSKSRLRKSLATFTQWCRKNRHKRSKEFAKTLNAKLRGYYNYYGVIGNYDGLSRFFYQATRILFKWLNRRSQRKSYSWAAFNDFLRAIKIEKPRITDRTTNLIELFV